MPALVPAQALDPAEDPAPGLPSVLAVYAHPDDADVGAGGTLARLARTGHDVALVLVTSGDAGGFENAGQDRMSERRRGEQREAAAALGITDVTFLTGYRDGHVREGMGTEQAGLVRDVVAAVRLHRADLILTTSPEYNFGSTAANHPDHRAVGRAVVEAAYPAAGNPFDYRELGAQGLEAHDPLEVWFQGHREVNHVVALTPEDLDAKVSAVRSHPSQFQDPDGIETFVRSRAAEEVAGTGDAEAGERFYRWVVRGLDGSLG